MLFFNQNDLFNDNEGKGEKARVKIMELKVKVKAANIPIQADQLSHVT